MHKRGQAEVWQVTMIFEVFVALLIAVFLLATSLSYGVVSGFNEKYASEDIRLIAESVFAAPGKVKVSYPLGEDYKVSIAKEVKVTHDASVSGVFGSSYLVMEKDTLSGEIKLSRESKK